MVPGGRIGLRGSPLLRRARLRRPTPGRTSPTCTVPRSGCSPRRCRWSPPCREPPSAVAAGSPSRPTSGWPPRAAASAPNFARFGFHHGFALTVTLPAVVGRQAAADLLLTGRRVGGDEARALGLCDRVVAEGEVRRRGDPLRARAGGLGALGRPGHQGHLAPRPGGGRPARHGARVCAADGAAAAPPTSPKGCAPQRSDVPPTSRGPEEPAPCPSCTRATLVHVGRPRRPVPRRHRRPGALLRRAGLLRHGGCARHGRGRRRCVSPSTRSKQSSRRRSATGGWAHLHRPGRRDHLHHPSGHPLGVATRLHLLPAVDRGVRRPDRARRPALLGPGRLQEARRRGPVSLAPGQRVRVRRAPAVPDVLGGAHRRHGGERLPLGGARACTGAAPCSTSTPTSGFVCLRDPAGRRRRPGACRQHRGLLVADPPRHRTQPDGRGAQGLHRPVRTRAAPRCSSPGPTGRWPGSPPTTARASTRCSVGACGCAVAADPRPAALGWVAASGEGTPTRDEPRGSVMTHTAPVRDWATDFDVMDPAYLRDPFTIWDELRGTCPIPHTDRRKSTWMPLRYDDVTAIAHDVEHFSSLKIAVIPADEDADPEEFEGPILEYGLPPISSDPPLHTWTRRLLLPWFSHKRVESYVPMTRELCRRLLDGFAGSGPGRCRGRLRAADPGAGDRPHPGRVPRPLGHVHRVGARRARVRRRPGSPPQRRRAAAELLPRRARATAPPPGGRSAAARS